MRTNLKLSKLVAWLRAVARKSQHADDENAPSVTATQQSTSIAAAIKRFTRFGTNDRLCCSSVWQHDQARRR
jgi:hypothetical protein